VTTFTSVIQRYYMMQYYAKIKKSYYRLFAVKESEGTDPANSFIKWSICSDPENHKIISSDHYTIHPDKIQIKTEFKQGTILIGDFKDKTSNKDYQTLYEIGYSTEGVSLVYLYEAQYGNGFGGNKSYNKNQLRKGAQILNFPTGRYNPFWMSAYYTKLGKDHINSIFGEEALDEIIYFRGELGNIVTLIKHVTPEWERLGLDPDNKSYGWNWKHPTFRLARKYGL
jgi:hypothetical protein